MDKNQTTIFQPFHLYKILKGETLSETYFDRVNHIFYENISHDIAQYYAEEMQTKNKKWKKNKQSIFDALDDISMMSIK